MNNKTINKITQEIELMKKKGLTEEQRAKVIANKSAEKVRFRWLDEHNNESDIFFEFKIQEDELTKDVSLVVTDFADEEELEEAKQLWETQIADLKLVLGSA